MDARNTLSSSFGRRLAPWVVGVATALGTPTRASAAVDPPGCPRVVGWLEAVTLPEAGLRATAKLDTGARTSALDARNIERFDRDGQPWIRFQVADGLILSPPLERPVVEERTVRSSVGRRSRPIVALWACIAGERRRVLFALSDRSSLHYPLLLGRRALEGRLAVDPGLHHRTDGNCPPPPRGDQPLMDAVREALRRDLSTLCGTRAVSVSTDACSGYGRSGGWRSRSVAGHRPDAVVWPGSLAEVSAVLRYAQRQRLPVTPVGGGTQSLGWGPPTRAGLVLDTSRLRRLDVQGRRWTVGAGVWRQVLDSQIRRRGQSPGWELDPPRGPSTLGGWFCTRGGGSGRLPAVRRIRAVSGSGELIDAPCTPHAGDLDVFGLLAASAGILGVIGEVELEADPRPPVIQRWSMSPRNLDSALAAAAALWSGAVVPETLVIHDAADQLLRTGAPRWIDALSGLLRADPLGLGQRATGLLAHAGGRFTVSVGYRAAQRSWLDDAAQDLSDASRRWAGGMTEPQSEWSTLDPALTRLVQGGRSVWTGSAAVSVSSLTSRWAQVERAGAGALVALRFQAWDPVSGILHATVVEGDARGDGWRRVRAALQTPSRTPALLDTAVAERLRRAVAAAWDPHGILRREEVA